MDRVLDAGPFIASRRDGGGMEWLMDEPGVPYKYFLAVLEGNRQGRWRQAKKPEA
jgi:hypothetical protein